MMREGQEVSSNALASVCPMTSEDVTLLNSLLTDRTRHSRQAFYENKQTGKYILHVQYTKLRGKCCAWAYINLPIRLQQTRMFTTVSMDCWHVLAPSHSATLSIIDRRTRITKTMDTRTSRSKILRAHSQCRPHERSMEVTDLDTRLERESSGVGRQLELVRLRVELKSFAGGHQVTENPGLDPHAAQESSPETPRCWFLHDHVL